MARDSPSRHRSAAPVIEAVHSWAGHLRRPRACQELVCPQGETNSLHWRHSTHASKHISKRVRFGCRLCCAKICIGAMTSPRKPGFSLSTTTNNSRRRLQQPYVTNIPLLDGDEMDIRELLDVLLWSFSTPVSHPCPPKTARTTPAALISRFWGLSRAVTSNSWIFHCRSFFWSGRACILSMQKIHYYPF